MSPLEFVSALIDTLAWPSVAVVAVIVFKNQVRKILDRPMSSLKAGPVEANWIERTAEIDSDLGTSPTSGPGELGRAELDYVALAKISPESAILTVFRDLEIKVSDLLASKNLQPPKGGVSRMVMFAAENGVIPKETADGIRGLAVLRNMVVHEKDSDIDEARALDYIRMARAASADLDRNQTQA